jgi:HEAT repeat protein
MAHRLIVAVVIVALLQAGCRSGPGFRESVSGLESSNADIRRESALALGRMKLRNARVREAAIIRLSVMAEMDADALARSAALMALGHQSPERAVDTAKLLRTDAGATVRSDAARIMGMHGDPSCVPVLVEMVRRERNDDVRREAVKALGRFREPPAVAELIERLEDPDLSVVHAAHLALVQLTGRDFAMDRRAWRKWYGRLTAETP